MDKIIVIDDKGIQKELEQFLVSNKTHVRLNTYMDELTLGQNPMLQEIIRQYEEKHKIRIRSKDRIYIFKQNDLVRLSIVDGKTCAFLLNGKIREIFGTLDALEEQLSNFPFLRTHPDHIVNMNFISGIKGKDEKRIELLDKSYVPICDERMEIILHYFHQAM